MVSVLACMAMLGEPPKPDFMFAGVGYVHRYSKGGLHEYTPTAQTDLTKWKDMVTLNVYAQITDGEGLAKAANSVLETYEKNGAKVVRTDSVPKKAKSEAEHLIVVLFPRPDFIEASFARFKMHEGHGVSLVYGHRVYGKAAGDEMAKWLKAKGEAVSYTHLKTTAR